MVKEWWPYLSGCTSVTQVGEVATRRIERSLRLTTVPVLRNFLQLHNPDLVWTIRRENAQWMVTVTTERFAAYVELGLKDGYSRFSDNYFSLSPAEEREIDVLQVHIPQTEGRLPYEELAKHFHVRSLVDTYLRGRFSGEFPESEE